MSEVCPKCGAKDIGGGYYKCSSFEYPCGSFLESHHCTRNQLAAAQAESEKWKRMYREGFDLDRVLAWQYEEDRRDPTQAFTAGGERTIANLIADEKRRCEAESEKLRERVAELETLHESEENKAAANRLSELLPLSNDDIGKLLYDLAADRIEELQSSDRERKAQSMEMLITMMEGVIEAGKHVEGDDRTASRNELCDAYLQVYAKQKARITELETLLAHAGEKGEG